MTDFSDEAKRAHGIAAYDMAAEIKALKIQIGIEQLSHASEIDALHARIRETVIAFDEGRRGDALSMLRAMVRGPVKPARAATDGDKPGAA